MTRLRPIAALVGFALLAVAALGALTLAGAQDADDKSAFIRFVERQISTPEMQIRLGQIDGALSSDVTITSITIADRDGVWLTIENVHLVWTRLALLSGTLDIDLLEADRILLPRLAAKGGASASPDLEVPELPVEVVIDALRVARVEIGEAVLGSAAELSVDGSMTLAGGSLAAKLDIERLDAGGRLALDASYGNESRELALKLELSEPEGGVVANLLALEGRPAVDFVVDGRGPLDDFRAEVSLAANGERLFGGPATIAAVDDGYRFVADLRGGLEGLVSPRYAGYFGGDSRIVIDATRRNDGTYSLASVDLGTGVLRLAASGELAADHVPTRLELDATLGAAGGEPVPLPGFAAASVGSARMTASLGSLPGDRWRAEFDLVDLRLPELNAGRTRIEAGGIARGLADPARREVSFEIAGRADELGSDDPDIADVLGRSIRLDAEGEWTSGNPIMVRNATADNGANTARFVGTLTRDRLDGTYLATAADLSLFRGLLGRDLGGGVDFRALGMVGTDGESFDLHIDTSARNLELGISALDPLFEGETSLRGRVARAKAGFAFEALALSNARATVQLDGLLGNAAANLVATGRIADLAPVDRRVAGAASFRAELSGPAADRTLSLTANGEGLRLMDRAFAEAEARVEGRIGDEGLRADVALSGNLAGVPVSASARLERLADGAQAIRAIDVNAGQTALTGDIAVLTNGRLDGALDLDAPELAVIAPLLLAEASGALRAGVALSAEGGDQSVAVTANAANVTYDGYGIAAADIDFRADRIHTTPAAEGRVAASGVRIGRFTLQSLVATASRDGDATRFNAEAGFERGTLTTAGALAPEDGGGFRLALDDLSLASDLGDARLAQPAVMVVKDGIFGFDAFDLRVADGRVVLSGTAGEKLDLRAQIDALPLGLANAVAPWLEASGRVSGSVTAAGDLDRPSGEFDLSAAGVSAEPLGKYGVRDLDVTARGRFADGVVDLAARTRISGGEVTAEGRVGETLDVNVQFRDLPLALANTVAPELSLGGSASGTIAATGSLDTPRAEFTVEAAGVTAARLRKAGLEGLAVRASGRFAEDRIRLDDSTITGNGIRATARGTVPLDGRGLDLEVSGDLPLAIANQYLIDRGARVSGTARVDVRITGSLSRPELTGTATGEGLALADAGSGISIRGIGITASFDRSRVTITRATGSLGRGTVSVTGTVGIEPGLGYPADLAITLRNARYEDGRLVAATLDGDLTLRGPLADNAVLGGTIRVARAEIIVPENLPASATLLDVQHRNAPPEVIATLRRAGIGESGRSAAGGSSSGLVLDLRIDAPARVFVRGRGLDTELGGQVTLTGPIGDIRPVGSFTMRRGRIDILGKRINFSRGQVTLVGDLDPILDFVATSSGDSVTVTITVSGSATDPDVAFSSSPELPEDEVLSQLLFGRGIDSLSPLQLAQLGFAAAQLAGAGGGTGVLDQLRAGTGLDNLDVTTDSEGNVAVEAGRYVNENVYLGVKGGQESSGGVINLDIGDGFTARAEAGQRDSKFGIFFEREY